MTERTTHTFATFLHPFSLPDVDKPQPPGTYLIETVEATIDNLSFIAYRRVSTTITLPALDTPTLRKQIVTIDPKDLAAAQHRDSLARNNDGDRLLTPTHMDGKSNFG
ncbi:hypothetical protein ACO2I3_06215 [Leptospira interrogans]